MTLILNIISAKHTDVQDLNLEDLIEMMDLARQFLLQNDTHKKIEKFAETMIRNGKFKSKEIFHWFALLPQLDLQSLKMAFVHKIFNLICEKDEEAIFELQEMSIQMVNYLLDIRISDQPFRLRTFKLWLEKNQDNCTSEDERLFGDTLDLDNDFTDEQILTDLRKSGLYRHINVYNEQMNKNEEEIEELNDALKEVGDRSDKTFEEMEKELAEKDKIIQDLQVDADRKGRKDKEEIDLMYAFNDARPVRH